MADEREVFTILEDEFAEGVGLIGKEVDDPVGDIQMPVLAAQKAGGGEAKIPLNAPGTAVITTDISVGGGVCINGQAQSVAGSTSFTDVLALILALEKTYMQLEFSGSCTHATLWEVVAVDDVGGSPTGTKIHTFMTGPGQFTVSENLDCGEFDTIGGTGVQNLVLRGKNLRKASDLHGYLGIKEF